jgi:RES domain-containing protein
MSESEALCVLELLVQKAQTIPARHVLISAHIPEDLSIERLDRASLPEDWHTRDNNAQSATRDIGTRWLSAMQSAVLLVPSAVVRTGFNILINPAHQDFQMIRFADPVEFDFDARLR